MVYENLLSSRVRSITPSLTLAITAKAKKMKADGISVIGFGAGEPDFNTPDFIIEAAKRALDDGFTKYTPSSGTLELRRIICKKLLEENGLTYEPADIVVSNGAKHSLHNAIMAVIDEGDEVIIPSPYWLTYPELVKVAGGVPIFVDTGKSNGYKLSAEAFESAISGRTKMLILNSPNNPTGAVYNESELKAIAAVAVRHDVLVLSDEIYEKLVYDEAKHISIASFGEDIKSRTIVINGLSKSCSMTGWRIGYMAAPRDIAKAVDGLQSHATSNPCSVSQKAAEAAMSHPAGKAFTEEMQETFAKRKEYLVSRVREIPEFRCDDPEGAFYVFVDIGGLIGKSYQGHKLRDALDVAEHMLSEGVAVIPGNAFGAPDHIRLSYAIGMEEIAEGMNRIAGFTAKCK